MRNYLKYVDVKKPSAISLVIMNLGVLGSAYYFEWSLFDIVCAFWVENIVIGLLNVVKTLMAQGVVPFEPWEKHLALKGVKEKKGSMGSKIAAAFSFLSVYGLFIAFHGIGIVMVFKIGIGEKNSMDKAFDFINEIPNSPELIQVLVWSAACLFVSHFISLMTNFIRKKEYLKVNGAEQAKMPYKRLFIVQLTTMVAGIVLIFTNYESFVYVALFVLLKILVDLNQHIKEHAKFENE